MSDTSPKEYFKNKKRYVQTGQLGRGGMAIVYESRDEYFQRSIAFKTLKDGPNRTKRETEFIREAMIMAKLEHPGIVPIHGLITETDTLPSITMGKVKGLSLQAKIQESRKDPTSWPLKERLQFFLKLVEIVAYAHNRGVLHRDIKPGNIMIGEVGEVILLDWGLAKVMEVEHDQEINDDEDTSITRIDDTVLTSMESMSGSIKGTPYYMSPESARGRSELVNEQSDVFSLGAVLYELITFEFYILGTKAMEVLGNAADSNTRSLGNEELKSSINADTNKLPPEVAFILRKSLAPEKLFRYRNAMELQHDLMAYFNDKPIKGFGDSLGLYRFKKWFSRNGLSLMLLTIPILITFYIAQIINQQTLNLENQLMFENEEYDKKRTKKRSQEIELAKLKENHKNLLNKKEADLQKINKLDQDELELFIVNTTINGEIEGLEESIEEQKLETEMATKTIQQLDQDILQLSSTYANLLQIQKRKKDLEFYTEFIQVAPEIGKEFQFINKFVHDGKILSSLEYINKKELFEKDPFVTEWYTYTLLQKVKHVQNPNYLVELDNENLFLEGEPKFIATRPNLLERASFSTTIKLSNYYPSEEWSHHIELNDKMIYYSKSGKVLEYDSKLNKYKGLAKHETLPQEVIFTEAKQLVGRYNNSYLFFQKNLNTVPILIFHPRPVLAYEWVDNKLRVEEDGKLYEYNIFPLSLNELGWEESEKLEIEEFEIDFELDPTTHEEYDNIVPSNYKVINSKMPLGPWLMVNQKTNETHFRNLDPETGIDQPLWVISNFKLKSNISDGYGGWLVLSENGELYSLKPDLPALPMSPQNAKFEKVFPILHWNISLSQDLRGQVFVHYLSTGQYLFKAGDFPKIESIQSDPKELKLSLTLEDGKSIMLDL